jgi:hypothetical protein
LIVAALAAGGGLGALTASMRRTQTELASAYTTAAVHQRKAAGATRTAEPQRAIPPAPGCVSGVEGFAGAAAAGISAFPGARLATLLAISDAAVRSEREAELLRPAPTLPKRMGLGGTEPVAPPRLACDGKGFAEAHVVTVPAPPAKPPKKAPARR